MSEWQTFRDGRDIAPDFNNILNRAGHTKAEAN